MRIGIFFGGYTREREISFAGGRTVYDNLNKSLFDPVPIFVDSFGNFILLNWEYVYKGSIRDFYPPVAFLPDSPNEFQVYAESLDDPATVDQHGLTASLGTVLMPHELKDHIDMAFLALHGPFGEDGVIQGLLESLQIPYTGSGILPSSIGINKRFQKQMMEAAGWPCPPYTSFSREAWKEEGAAAKCFAVAKEKIGLPFVVKPVHQGSSVGVSAIQEDDLEAFRIAMRKAFFMVRLDKAEWEGIEDKVAWLKDITDIRAGIGIPVKVGEKTLYHPEALLTFLQEHFAASEQNILLEGVDQENEVIIEAFIDGTEFSCIVVQDENGLPVALPPTEIIKGKEVFDYRSKYLAGLSRKITPINIADDKIEAIRTACEKLFGFFDFNVYARIDGFIQSDGTVFLNDPNTTSGMLPSSFFFHQAAEIGLAPSQFLTYIIRTSLSERIRTALTDQSRTQALLDTLDQGIQQLHMQKEETTKVAVILGGYSSERHISVESGRNIFEKLNSSKEYEPIPVFLSGDSTSFQLHQIPINLLLKDNADDIVEKIQHFSIHPVIEKIKTRCQGLTSKYGAAGYSFYPQYIPLEELPQHVEEVFIALHGRPGEDGMLQGMLDEQGLPYNGSSKDASSITINKYQTNNILQEHGFAVAAHTLVSKRDWSTNQAGEIARLQEHFPFPFIAKPVDDGCSSAVKKINNVQELKAFAALMFREQEDLMPQEAATLSLKPKEEFPQKDEFLVEELIHAKGAKYFLEITGGLLTHVNEQTGQLEYEIFEPSEALATEAVLSLEEKFLAGQGQNITPARFGKGAEEYTTISTQVKADLEKVARILGVTGYARIDAFVRVWEDLRVETIIIEVNSLPGMTPATCIFHQCAINGYKPFDFIDRILDFGTKKQHLEAIS